MKKVIRTILPIFLALVIILCMAWYLLVYDRLFTLDVLLSCARYSESRGDRETAAWFYNLAYQQADDGDSIAIELANQYINSGNYTRAEYTLVNAIKDGGGINLYIALSKAYVDQDKLLDAVALLDRIDNKEIKQALESMRPAAPTASPDPGLFREYIPVTVTTNSANLYVAWDGTYPSISNPASNHTATLVDGVNTISAIAVSDNGLVSPLSEFEYTVGGVIKEIKFADSAVEQEVRRILNIKDTTPVYTNQIWTIKEFEVPRDATSYADLQHFSYLEKLVIKNGLTANASHFKSLVALQELSISDTVLTDQDLAAVGSLPELKKLTLQNCNLSNVEALASSKKLVYLDLNSNIIRNISPLAELPELTELNLHRNTIGDLSPIAGLTKLSKLNISSNLLTSIAPLADVTSITELDASNNAITDLGIIGILSNLSNLNLSYNQLTDITDLYACNALTVLNVSNNKLKDVDCIVFLKNLMFLDFSFNQVKTLPEFEKSSLVSVIGSNNALTNINSLGKIQTLNSVNMDYNPGLSSVSALANCNNLVQVFVYGTKVTDVSALTKKGIIVNYNPILE